MGTENGCTGLPPETGYIQGYGREATQEEGGSGLDPTWLQGFLNRCTALSACFASTMDLQRAYANALESIKDHFRKLRDVIRY